MPRIVRSIEISASRDAVWEIISDLDNEPEYWYGTREVRTISKEGNVITREITQNFRNHKISQRATLNPKESVKIEYLKGLTQGVKTITVESEEENLQILTVVWVAHFTGIFWFLTPWLKRHSEKGTIDALDRIKDAAEHQE